MTHIPILTYHQIANNDQHGSPFRSLVVTPGRFGQQMAMLKALGYQGLSMTELMPYLQGVKRGRVVGITLDDGYLNNLVNALPVLQKYGFTATCYCVSQRIGFTNSWDEAAGVPQVPLMDAGQVREWVRAGQEVGAHTRNHVHLQSTPAELAQEEIAGCKTELEHITGRPVNHFCYPYGEFGPEHSRMAHDAGFLTATTTQRARATSADDLYQLPRVPVLRNTHLPLFWAKLATAYEDRRRA